MGSSCLLGKMLGKSSLRPVPFSFLSVPGDTDGKRAPGQADPAGQVKRSPSVARSILSGGPVAPSGRDPRSGFGPQQHRAALAVSGKMLRNRSLGSVPVPFRSWQNARAGQTSQTLGHSGRSSPDRWVARIFWVALAERAKPGIGKGQQQAESRAVGQRLSFWGECS
ncbi:unnamed protein product [Calypogeia fissa]